jgi:N-acetylgalactosamine-6-sulfatase
MIDSVMPPRDRECIGSQPLAVEPTTLSHSVSNRRLGLTKKVLRRGLSLALATPGLLVGISSGWGSAGELQSGAPASRAGNNPNIVFLLADDLGYGDLGCYGGRARTPGIDRLAREGVRFTQFYANGPECSPTRAAFITGRYQHRVGGLECAIGSGNVGRYDDAIRLRSQNDLGLPTSENSIARVLQRAGYATAVAGKWHLGYEDKFAPRHHGFEHAFYALGGGMDYFHHVEELSDSPPMLRLNSQVIRREGYFTDLVAEEAVRFIEANRARPFFLYVPFTAPHSPFQGPNDRQPKPLPRDSPLWNQGKAPPAVYAAMIERMDAAVERIFAALEAHAVASNTLVVFTSDNGGTASARNAPLTGTKGSTMEGGIRVPSIARWPGRLPAGAVSEQVGITMDLTASFARVAGAMAPSESPWDGEDVLARVAAREPPTPRTLFWRGRRGENSWWAVREGDLKYVRRMQAGETKEWLFDLAADVAEQDNLLAQRPADVQRLKQLLARWETEVRPRR